MTVIINSIAQISTQEPLTEKWFSEPQECAQRHNVSVEAPYGEFISPMVARRMGKLLKRAAATSMKALSTASVSVPDAIVFGTGLGCFENSEKFLTAMIEQGESCLQPTYFINSTHNTIASQVATLIKCHGYNNTYSHLGVSFESALLDCLMQFELGKIRTALVGGYDEMTDTCFDLFDGEGYWRSEDRPGALAGEAAVAMVLSDEKTDTSKCSLEDVALCCGRPLAEVTAALERFLAGRGITPSDIDLVITGRTGDTRFDPDYSVVIDAVFGKDKPQAAYKHIFGESFTAGAYGVMLGAEVLYRSSLHRSFRYGAAVASQFRKILLINSFQSRDWSFILLGL